MPQSTQTQVQRLKYRQGHDGEDSCTSFCVCAHFKAGRLGDNVAHRRRNAQLLGQLEFQLPCLRRRQLQSSGAHMHVTEVRHDWSELDTGASASLVYASRYRYFMKYVHVEVYPEAAWSPAARRRRQPQGRTRMQTPCASAVDARLVIVIAAARQARGLSWRRERCTAAVQQCRQWSKSDWRFMRLISLLCARACKTLCLQGCGYALCR
jgi:hypothetical protein